MEFDRYRSVVRMVLAKHVPDADQVVTELYSTLELAEALVSEMNIATRKPPQREVRQSMSTGEPTGAAGMVSAAAPPVALMREEDEPDRADVDYWESRPGRGDGPARLQAMLEKVLPQSIDVHPPGFDAPFAITRGIGSPGLTFVHVSYVIPGDTLGPRVTLMTSQKTFNAMAIERDIRTQAEAIYSKEKRILTPHIVTPIQPPSSAEMQRMLDRDRAQQAETPVTAEDHRVAEDWASKRGPKWL